MPGAGLSRAGLDPAGFASPTATSPLSASLNASVSRSFDPATHDYSPPLATACDFTSMPIVLAKVLEALGNRVGSFSWAPTTGDPSLSIDRDRGDMAVRVRSYTELQLKPMTDAGEIEIQKISIIIALGKYQRAVRFRDLSTGAVHSTAASSP